MIPIANSEPCPSLSHSSLAMIPSEAVNVAEKNLRDILAMAIEHAPPHAAVVVFDTRCELAIALTASKSMNIAVERQRR